MDDIILKNNRSTQKRRCGLFDENGIGSIPDAASPIVASFTQGGFGAVQIPDKLDKLEFDGESVPTIRARCVCFRYFLEPLGIVTA